jgi:hypothetical protein
MGGNMRIFGRSWCKEDGFKHLLHVITSPIRIFMESVKKILEWFPVIWKDRDWDYDYFYLVLKHKLKMMSKYEKKYAMAEKSDEIAGKMDEAIDLIEKLLNYDYEKEDERADKDRLFDLIKENIYDWWD